MGYGWKKTMTNHKFSLNGIVEVLLARKKLVAVSLGVGAVLVLLAFGPLNGFRDSDGDLLTYTVNRGDFVIDIVESGSVEASKSEVIRSQVEGRATIISLVPEGTLITEKDVEEGMVLVELDSAPLREDEVRQEIAVEGESAKLANAKSSYEIRVNQNESDRKQGELKVKFAKMDLQKYLGSEAAAFFLEGTMEFSTLLADEGLDGEALQKKRELESNIDLAKEDVARAVVRLDWTKKLFEKGFVTRDDLQADELALKREEVRQEQAETALKLFSLYEFEKEAERRRSDYEEAVKELDRIIARNRAALSNAEVGLNSAEASYEHQVSQLEKIREQVENCTIRAPHPGMVVYAGMNRRQQTDRIEEGKQVREQEEIIHIPNTTSMMVRTTVHESVIARVHKKQKAKITIDSLPDRTLEGEVTEVAILPDQENRWLNPNLKVYVTNVSILGTDPDLKPGMSAQVRIIIKERKGVLMVPLQAVTTHNRKRVCFVKTALGTERRIIKTGDYNDRFIEVKKGLEEGDKVVLNADDFSSQG
jgi:HlyD family secretion protein